MADSNQKTKVKKTKKTFNQVVSKHINRHIKQLHGEDPVGLYNFIIGEVEKPLFTIIMEYCNQNQSKAAKCLGISRSTLRKKLNEIS